MFKKTVGIVAAMAALALPAGAQAAQPGQLCQTNQSMLIHSTGGVIYTVGNAWWVRIVNYYGADTYWGHANGYPDGWFYRNTIDQGSCHW